MNMKLLCTLTLSATLMVASVAQANNGPGSDEKGTIGVVCRNFKGEPQIVQPGSPDPSDGGPAVFLSRVEAALRAAFPGMFSEPLNCGLESIQGSPAVTVGIDAGTDGPAPTN
jgi:hypothetical protein